MIYIDRKRYQTIIYYKGNQTYTGLHKTDCSCHSYKIYSIQLNAP